jgi:hypothetical protein
MHIVAVLLFACLFNIAHLPEMPADPGWARSSGILPSETDKRAANCGDLVDLPDTVFSNSAYAERVFLIGTLRRGLL